MPVSITATVTPGLPVVTVQAVDGRMSTPAVPPPWPVFCKPHWLPNCGSLGVPATVA